MTSPPAQLANVFHNDGSNPMTEDVTNELLNSLRQGQDAGVSATAAYQFERRVAITASPESNVHEVLRRVWLSADGAELLAVARVIEERGASSNSLVFHTPVGDVRIAVVDVNGDPASLPPTSLFTVTVRDSNESFRPIPGVPMLVSLNRSNRRVMVTCLAEPAKLYKGLGIDLLCFVTQGLQVEKNGKIKEGAPSVVSGEPSVKTDNGEPVALGEKVASVKDFDVARSSYEPEL